MFWALARVSFRAAKIVSCNKNFFFMVYDQNYHNCSTLTPIAKVVGFDGTPCIYYIVYICYYLLS
jgi:hypothetical protein